jgi:CelD/BcsL family acetyltransferase involved in cellulose biosynthesis
MTPPAPPVHIRELTPDDAPAIARLEARFHDISLTDRPDEHRRRLAAAAAQGSSFSLGAFSGEALVGYVLCYGFEPTAFADEDGDAFYIEDATVAPEHRAVFARMLERFAARVRESFPGVWVEAHSIERVLPIWRKHEALFKRRGFAARRCEKTREIISGQARYALRWQSAARTGSAKLDAVFERLPSHVVSVSGRLYLLKVIRRVEDWDALEPFWDPLLLGCPEHTVFQSYLYQRLWWKHFGHGSELAIVVAVQEGKVAGIAPLRIKRERRYAFARTLQFVGSRWEVDRPQFLFPRDSLALTRALARSMAVSDDDEWGVADFYEQPKGAEIARILIEEFRAARCFVAEVRDSDCAYLTLEGTWQAYLAQRSQRLRKNLKAARHRLSSHGELGFEVYETLPSVREQLERFRELEQRSWKKGKGVGIASTPEYLSFYREMAEVFGRTRAFVVRVLCAGGRTVAATFGLVFDGTYYSLQITHDRDFDRCSPGTYLEALELEDCFRRRYREYDFLGGFLSNKSRWTSAYRFRTQVLVFGQSPLPALLYVLFCKVKPVVKELIRPFMRSWQPRPSP